VLNQCLTKADFFDLFGSNAVASNVIESIWRQMNS
jgi:hypothetical protein